MCTCSQISSLFLKKKKRANFVSHSLLHSGPYKWCECNPAHSFTGISYGDTWIPCLFKRPSNMSLLNSFESFSVVSPMTTELTVTNAAGKLKRPQ